MSAAVPGAVPVPTLSAHLVAPTAASMRRLGSALASVLRAGDLVLLTGDLGAGKTTLAAGIGAGLGVRGAVTSPTFVIAREHPPLGQGPWLVHVDAYRLGGLAEVEGLDLEASLDEAVTLVEWGTGLVEQLAADRLEVLIGRSSGLTGGHDEGAQDRRTVELRGFGHRWVGADLSVLEQACC